MRQLLGRPDATLATREMLLQSFMQGFLHDLYVEKWNRFGRMHAVRVTLERTERGWLARSVGAQGSGIISSLTRADAIALIGPGAEVKAGEEVEAIVLRDPERRW